MIRQTITRIARLALIGLFALPGISLAGDKNGTPPCYGEENFATQTALVQMVNAGLIKNFASIYRDNRQPYHLTTRLLDSEKIGEYATKDFPAATLYRQIQKVDVGTREGKSFEILSISEATSVECSMSGPTTILISPEFKVLSIGKSILNTAGDGRSSRP